MESEPSGQPNVVIRLAGRTGLAFPKVQVFVDGQPVGVLSDERARSLTLSPGPHRVVTRVGLLRSGTQFLSLAPGELVALECGYRRWSFALGVVFIAVSGVALVLTNLGQFGMAIAAQSLTLAVIVVDLLMTFTVPGAKFYLRRGAVAPYAEDMPERLQAPSLMAGLELGPRRFQIGLRGLLILVACCAPLFWLAREAWDRRPQQEPDRAFRMLRSADESERLSGLRALRLLVTLKSLTPKQVDAAITALLVALRDGSTEVRKAAAETLFSIVFEAGQRSAAVPQVQAVATGLMEGVCDAEPVVRHRATLALSSIYFMWSARGLPPPPLPRDTGRFAGLLAAAATDPDPVVRRTAIGVLLATAPRLGGAPPPALIAAFDAADPASRCAAAWTITQFPAGHDRFLPALLGRLERDPAPVVRAACDAALNLSRLTPAAVPELVKALHSNDRRVRFRAADRLSYIVPRPVEVVPALLPLLEEQFTPQTAFERKHPTWADPAVAATWALGAIVQRTPTPGPAEAALKKLLRDRKHPWRAGQVLDAFERISDDKPPVAGPTSHAWSPRLNLGSELMRAGKVADAEAEYRAALTLYQKLADRSRDVDEFRAGVASAHTALGIVLSYAGKPAEAEAECRSAMALLQKLANDSPDTTRFRNALAMSHNNLGILLIQTGRPAAAEAEYRAALALRRKLVVDDPDDREFQFFLANTLDNLRLLLSRTGRPAEAERRSALAIFQKLTGEKPELPDDRHLVAQCLSSIGHLLTNAGRAAEAVDSFEQAHAILDALAGEHPSVEDYRNSLAFTHSGLGWARRRRGEHAAAVADCRRAVALWEGLAAPSWIARYALASNHALLAGLAAKGVSELSPAEGQDEADRAMAVLRPLVAQGYRNPKMSTDRDFDPLRGRPDFPLLMMDLVMPGEPFADQR